MSEEVKLSMWELLRKKYPVGEYTLLEEVRNDAGFNASNSADFFVMGLWPSRGLEIQGFERKASRSDWLRELKNPKKAEAIFKYCDRFWLLTDSESVVLHPGEEIPPTWGWMCRNKNRLMIKKEAPKLTPEPISRGIVASILKRATVGLIHPSQIEETIKERVKITTKYQEREAERLTKELQNIREEVRTFEKASGINITNDWRYNSNEIGEAVKFALNGGLTGVETKMRNLHNAATAIVKEIETKLKSISPIVEPEQQSIA